MEALRNNIMHRVQRVYVLKKISSKICLFIAASMVGMTFVSTIDVIRNTIHVALKLNLGAFFDFVVSAFTHTEHITYIALTLSLTAIILTASDLASIRSKQYSIEFQ